MSYREILSVVNPHQVLVGNESMLEQARGGYISINVRVFGFWSDSVITGYIRREHGYEKDSFKWVPSISHSSGGRDTKVCDDITATRCFGLAMQDFASFMSYQMTRVDEFEKAYQEYKAELAAERARIIAEQKAAEDADAPLGFPKARDVIERAVLMSKEFKRDVEILFLYRGSDMLEKLYVIDGQRVVFYKKGKRINREEAVKSLANASARSGNMGWKGNAVFS
jgi:hypothetical protein